jgi:hypothetical protein
MRDIFQLVNLKARDHYGEVGIDGRIILKWSLKNSSLFL